VDSLNSLRRIVNILWANIKEKKLILFSSKNHRCIYFRFHSKITKTTYLYLMVDIILHKSKNISGGYNSTQKKKD